MTFVTGGHFKECTKKTCYLPALIQEVVDWLTTLKLGWGWGLAWYVRGHQRLGAWKIGPGMGFSVTDGVWIHKPQSGPTGGHVTTITQSTTDICSTCSMNLNFPFFCISLVFALVSLILSCRYIFGFYVLSLFMSVLWLHAFGHSKVTTRPRPTIFFVKVKISDSDLLGRSMDLTIWYHNLQFFRRYQFLLQFFLFWFGLQMWRPVRRLLNTSSIAKFTAQLSHKRSGGHAVSF